MHQDAEGGSAPTAVDRGFQLAYTCAYQLMRVYWRVRHPTTHGALVLLWSKGEVLLVRNSYVPYYSAPGGYVHVGEPPADAVVRELKEEIGFDARASDLTLALDVTHEWEGKLDHVQIFTLDVEKRPSVKVDYREVIAAEWFSREAALKLNLFPPLRTVIEQRSVT
jgi:8-oxo-dGTP diphosphatase